jgi:hypothetical protein
MTMNKFSRIQCLFGIVILLASCGNFAKIVKIRLQHELVTKNFYTTIPFEYRHGLIIIEADLNGKGKRKFILDNGTGLSVIFNNHLNEFGLQKTKVFNKTAFVGGLFSKNYFYAPTHLSIGDVDYTNVSMVERENPFLPCNDDLCGIIGALPLLKHSLQINYKTKNIIFTDKPEKFDSSLLINKIKFNDNGKLYVKSKIGGTDCNIILDLGNSSVLCVPNDIYKNIAKDNQINIVNKGNGFPGKYDIKNDTTTTDYFKVKQLDLGGINVTNVVAHNYGQAPLMLLGSQFLQNYIVTVDMKNSVLYLKENSLNVASRINSFGFRIGFNNKVAYIAYLNEKLADSLSVGDKIISINTINANSSEFCNMSSFALDEMPANTTIALKVTHQNKVVDIKLKNIY